jgi:hypothetical protein
MAVIRSTWTRRIRKLSPDSLNLQLPNRTKAGGHYGAKLGVMEQVPTPNSEMDLPRQGTRGSKGGLEVWSIPPSRPPLNTIAISSPTMNNARLSLCEGLCGVGPRGSADDINCENSLLRSAVVAELVGVLHRLSGPSFITHHPERPFHVSISNLPSALGKYNVQDS